MSLLTALLVFAIIHLITATKNDTEPWKGIWFPQNPEKSTMKNNDLLELFNTSDIKTSTKESWRGNWFPRKPTGEINLPNTPRPIYVDPGCDDGKKNIAIDFDPENKTHNYNYLCFDLKDKYDPNYATFPIQREYIIPPVFRAPSYCQNETIEYEEQLPTFGAHRYLYPKYGEYVFLPVQRWMHSLEYGVVVMLYHPCANRMQIEKLKNTLKACLYRHIISPSILLSSKRPLALVVWGKSLEISVVDMFTVVEFLKTNAKKGSKSGEPNIEKYDAGLVTEARLVTDESDSEICANIIL